MATKSAQPITNKKKKKSPVKSPAAPASNSNKLFIIGIVVIVVLGLLAIFLLRPASGLGNQVQSVKITGDKLSPFVKDRAGNITSETAIGKKAPEVSGKNFDGDTVEIKNDGKAKLVVFLAHWCPHCQNELPKLVAYLKENSLPDNVEVIGVATGTDTGKANFGPEAWFKKENVNFTTMADDKNFSVGEAFGLLGFPYFVAIDKDGNVVGRDSGEITCASMDPLIKLINQAAGTEAPSPLVGADESTTDESTSTTETSTTTTTTVAGT